MTRCRDASIPSVLTNTSSRSNSRWRGLIQFSNSFAATIILPRWILASSTCTSSSAKPTASTCGSFGRARSFVHQHAPRPSQHAPRPSSAIRYLRSCGVQLVIYIDDLALLYKRTVSSRHICSWIHYTVSALAFILTSAQ